MKSSFMTYHSLNEPVLGPDNILKIAQLFS